MAVQLTSLSGIDALGFDTIIDVRAPAEYAEDHIPGAISLPVLDDAERAQVGTVYKQVSPFAARKMGAALVARNAALHLEGPLADMAGGWKPLVYCWRGGQRSNSFASILAQIGWRVEVLEGGYKTYRRLVVEELYERPVRAPVVVLDGNTGSAKTEIIGHLHRQGLQVIDLEAMANHRGSLFGAMPGGQPSQKAFEGRLAMALSRLDAARPVVVEAESSKVGDLRLPPGLWKAMCAAPRIAIEAAAEARAAYLARAYGDLTADPEALAAVVARLRPLHPAERIEAWLTMAQTGLHEALALELMQHHYDPRYASQRSRTGEPPCGVVTAASLTPADIEVLAGQVAALVLSAGVGTGRACNAGTAVSPA